MKLRESSQFVLRLAVTGNRTICAGDAPYFARHVYPDIYKDCIEDGLISADVDGEGTTEYHWTALAELLYKLEQL